VENGPPLKGDQLPVFGGENRDSSPHDVDTRMETQELDAAVGRLIADFGSRLRIADHACVVNVRDGSYRCRYRIADGPWESLGDASRELREWPVHELVRGLEDVRDPRGAPAWGLDLSFDGRGGRHVALLFPDPDLEDLTKAPRDDLGRLPSWVYMNPRPTLIAQMSDHDLSRLVREHVEQARAILRFDSDVAYSRSIGETFYLVMINGAADGDIRNGRFDQFYARYAGQRPELIVDFRNSYAMLGPEWRALFDESIQLYAHFHDNVEAARRMLDLPALEKRTESDIMSRYYALDPSVDALRARYIRAHADEFTVPPLL